jgi:hypothetical protein
LGGFPAIIFPFRKTRPARRNQQHQYANVFNFDNNIENHIVNNIGWG